MISNHLSMVERNVPESARLAAAMEEFLNRDGQVTQAAEFAHNPVPPVRSNRVDPDTILKRRRPSPSHAERIALRRITESL